MDLLGGITIYITLWMVVFFMTLPLGVNIPDRIKKGLASSAPKRSRIFVKAMITTVISALLWGGLQLGIHYKWIPVAKWLMLPDGDETTEKDTAKLSELSLTTEEQED